jgi:hypothetical protein
MSVVSWLRNRKWSSTQGHRLTLGTARKPATFCPGLETLEDRDLPSFSSPITTAVYSPAAMVTADVNNDGKADLIVMDKYGGIGGYVLLGKGNGQFTAPYYWSYSGGSYTATAVAVADTNGDGKLDIVTGNDPGDGGTYGQRASISVFLGNGDGTFSGSQPFEWGFGVSRPESITVSDVNGDGRPDVILAGYGGGVDVAIQGSSAHYPWIVQSIALNDVGLNVTGSPYYIAVGDVNGDTKPDIVMAGGTHVDVLLNTGSGAFGAAQPYDAAGAVLSVAVGDVNGDGHLDIVTANGDWSNYSRSVSVLQGHGDGTFGTAHVYPVGGNPNSIALGDFNNDGKLDIVTTGTEVDVLLNNGDGTFGASQAVGSAGRSVVVADFNNDGFPDLAQIDGSGASIDVLLNGVTSIKSKGHK